MRIGEMVSNMMTISRHKENYAKQLQKANLEMATGKRVNSASDDPSAIGRIERTKAQLNESKIVQSALNEGINRNNMMEATLNGMSSASEKLSSLAVKHTSPGENTADIEAQAKSILDSMVDMMAKTSYNGVNPFSQATAEFRTSGGGTLTQNTPTFNIKANESDPTTYDITLNDGTELTGQSISDILDSDFITTNLTDQISSAKSSIGSSNNILEFRKNYEATREEILTKSLSNIQDADLSQSAIQSNIATQMIQMNQQNLSNLSGMMAREVGSIFDVRI